MDELEDREGYERVCAEIMLVAERESAALLGGRNVALLRGLNGKLLESSALQRVWCDLNEGRREDAVMEIGLSAAQEFFEQEVESRQMGDAPAFLGPYAEFDVQEARRNLEAVQRTIDLVKENEAALGEAEPLPLDDDLASHFHLIESPPKVLTCRTSKLSPGWREETALNRKECQNSRRIKAARPTEALVLLLHLYQEQLRELIILEALQPQTKDGPGSDRKPGTLIAIACYLALEGQPVLKCRMKRAEELLKDFLELSTPLTAPQLDKRVQKAVERARKALEKSTP